MYYPSQDERRCDRDEYRHRMCDSVPLQMSDYREPDHLMNQIKRIGNRCNPDDDSDYTIGGRNHIVNPSHEEKDGCCYDKEYCRGCKQAVPDNTVDEAQD